MTTKPRRRAGEGSVSQRADGMWIGTIDAPSLDGKRRQRKVSSKDYRECVRKLEVLKRELAEGVVVNRTTTVGDWLTHWLEDIHREHVRPKTYADYVGVVANITAAIGTKKLANLTPEDVRTMHTKLGRGRRRAHKAHVVLQRSLADAAAEGLVSRNVAALVRKPPVATNPRGSFTAEDAKTIIRYASENRSPMEATRWALAFLTGMREGEVLGLRWENVDLESCVADVSWQLQSLKKDHGCGDKSEDGAWPCGRVKGAYCSDPGLNVPPDFVALPLYKSLHLTRPKTNAGQRFVPLIPPLVTALKAIRSEGTPSPDGLVFHRADGTPISPREDYDAWGSLLLEAGIAEVGKRAPSMHQARHTTATLLRAAGVDEQTRMAILGHVSVEAQRIYAHENLVSQRAAMAALAELAPGAEKGN